MISEKFWKISGIAVVVVVLVTAGLWYYQKQGFLKVFPTREDRTIKKILVIDESKLRAPEGLTEEQFQSERQKLYENRDRVLANRTDAKAWFDYGYSKEFWNDHESAVAAWEKAYALQDLNFVTTLNLANAYQYFLKNWEKAEFYYLKTLELQPDYTLAFQGLTDLYRFNWAEKQGEVESAYLRAARNDSSNAGEYYANLVEFFVRREDGFNKAKQYLEEVKKLKPEAVADLLAAYPELN